MSTVLSSHARLLTFDCRIVTVIVQSNALTCAVCVTAGVVCVSGYTSVAWLFLFSSPKVCLLNGPNVQSICSHQYIKLYQITMLSALNSRKRQRTNLQNMQLTGSSGSVAAGDETGTGFRRNVSVRFTFIVKRSRLFRRLFARPNTRSI